MEPQQNPDPQDLADALRDFYLRSARVMDRMMTAAGASFARTKLLSLIAQDGPIRSTDIVEAFAQAPRTVTEAVDGLERDGLVRREPDPGDRRAKLITITPAGEAALEAVRPIRERYVEGMFGMLSMEDRRALMTILAKLDPERIR